MKCAIVQPSYIPWRGFFHQIRKADVFVFYDDAQYDRRGWRNRNRIKTQDGPKWLSIPVRSSEKERERTMIQDVEIAWDRDWNRVHLETLRRSYAKAPFLSRYWSMLSRWYSQRPKYLCDFTIDITIELARELGAGETKFIRSSSLGCSGAKTEKLLHILEAVGADHYISGPAAKAYLDVEMLNRRGISVEWMDYRYAEYRQLHPPYDPQVSVLDLLFMMGSESGECIW